MPPLTFAKSIPSLAPLQLMFHPPWYTCGINVFDKSGTVTFLSQNPDMTDVSAGASRSVLVKAQVNNLANADFDLLSSLGNVVGTTDQVVVTL